MVITALRTKHRPASGPQLHLGRHVEKYAFLEAIETLKRGQWQTAMR